MRFLSAIIIFFVVASFVICSCIQTVGAKAVAPNKQEGKCGPLYLWDQIGPDSYTWPTDYVDLYKITFDISDIVDDFDFVYLTDTPTLPKSHLDRNRDGISDLHFFRRSNNQLEWKPRNDRVRITQRGCWASQFNENCGYAMIGIQPKPGFQDGSARISIKVAKRCSPTGIDCSETHLFLHEYSHCSSPPRVPGVSGRCSPWFLCTG